MGRLTGSLRGGRLPGPEMYGDGMHAGLLRYGQFTQYHIYGYECIRRDHLRVSGKRTR